MKWLLFASLATAATAVPATSFAFNDAGRLPCYAAAEEQLNYPELPIDLNMTIGLMLNITKVDAYVAVPDVLGGGGVEYEISENQTRVKLGGYVPPSLPGSYPDDTPGKYSLVYPSKLARFLRVIAAWTDEKTVDENGREWTRLQATLKIKYEQRNGTVTSDFHESSAPMWVETSCRFAEKGPRGVVTSVPTSHDGVTVNTHSGHMEIFACGYPRTGTTGTVSTDLIVQPPQDFESMLYKYAVFVYEPSNQKYERAFWGYNYGDGAVLRNLELSLTHAQTSYLAENVTLPARVEVSYYTNLTAYENDYEVEGAAYLVNESFSISAQAEQAMLKKEIVEFLTNKSFVHPETEQVGSQQRAFFHFTERFNDTDKVDIEFLSRKDGTTSDFEGTATIYNTTCRSQVKSGNAFVTVYEINGAKTVRVVDAYSGNKLAMRETLTSVQAQGLLRMLANDWTSDVESLVASLSMSDSKKQELECAYCCIVEAQVAMANNTDFLFEVEFETVGTMCPLAKRRLKQPRIALTQFVDYVRLGQNTPKLYGHFESDIPNFGTRYNLTFDFIPSQISKGKIGAYFGHKGHGDMTFLNTDLVCPYREQVPAEYLETAEQLCGELQNMPTTTEPAGSAASLATSMALLLPCVLLLVAIVGSN